MTRGKIMRIAAVLLLVLAAVLAVKAWRDTLRMPVVERTTVTLADLPPGTPPLTIALISDIHVAGPDMPPARLAEIVTQINALEPDIVAIAGDFVGDKPTATHTYAPEEVIAPLGKLRPKLAAVAVPGNHDHRVGLPPLKRELEKVGIVLLANEAQRFGPVTIGGLDDLFTRHIDLPATLAAMDAKGTPQIMLTHSPEHFFYLPDHVQLMLAGSTHCGQIAYPWGGAPIFLSSLSDEYTCGRADAGGKTLIVSAGLGTSFMPIRLFTQPDIWLIELRPPER